MALTDDDIEHIRSIIVDAIESVILPRFDDHDKRFDAIEADVSGLKQDVSELKQDVSELKTDVRILKDDMRDVKTRLEWLEGEVQALSADIHELYMMQARTEKRSGGDAKFAKLSLEKKLLQLNDRLLQTAKEAGITLPR